MGTRFSEVYNRFLGKITDDMYMELTPEDTIKEDKQFKDITIQLFTLFRMAPAIEYETILCDDPEEKKELLGYRQRKMYIMEQDTKKTKDANKPIYYPVKSFLPAIASNTFINFLLLSPVSFV